MFLIIPNPKPFRTGDSKYHITLPARGSPVSRSASGMLMVDHTNHVTIHPVTFVTTISTVVMEVYIFEQVYDS